MMMVTNDSVYSWIILETRRVSKASSLLPECEKLYIWKEKKAEKKKGREKKRQRKKKAQKKKRQGKQ